MKATDWKVGISTGCFEREMFEQYAEAGIDCMELSLGYLPAEIDWKNAQKYAEETKIELWSYHLPFGPFAEIDISSKDKEKRDHTVNLFSERIKSAADIGVRNIIIHASVEPIKDEDRESLIAIA